MTTIPTRTGRTRLMGLLLAVTLLVPLQGVSSGQESGFDLDTGNGLLEVVIPQVVPVIFGAVSPHASDAPLVLRTTAGVTNAWFDALAPYHPTAVGVYSRIDRCPAGEGETNRNKNIAGLYASLHVLSSLLPDQEQQWRAMLSDVGLDPDDPSVDLTTAVGVGNHAGRTIAAVREHDGMNQLGDAGGRAHNRRPYADTTGYRPVNTPEAITDPSRWQPAIVTAGNGLFTSQRFVTPQLADTRPYSYDDPRRFRAPPPRKSDPTRGNGRFYREQADEVLAASAALTDRQEATAELFDNKIRSLGFSALHVAQQRQMTLDDFVQYDFLANVAAFDTAIAIWGEKRRHDAVRPFSAIAWLYGDRPVTAWGGPGRGTVDDLPPVHWTSYLPVADHPEYPSASASFAPPTPKRHAACSAPTTSTGPCRSRQETRA